LVRNKKLTYFCAVSWTLWGCQSTVELSRGGLATECSTLELEDQPTSGSKWRCTRRDGTSRRIENQTDSEIPPLTMWEVSKPLETAQNSLASCWRKGAARSAPRAADLQLLLKFYIKPDGSVKEVSITSRIQDKSQSPYQDRNAILFGCFSEAIGTLTFPKPRFGKKVLVQIPWSPPLPG
jgi:hypothetical protein